MSDDHGTLDFETYSEAGYVWDDAAQKWRAPAGMSAQKRGLEVVGVDNYVNHPTFEILSLAYDLKDGRGVRRWVPARVMDSLMGDLFRPAAGAQHPWELLNYVRDGGVIESWNAGFEWYVWRWAVKAWGWPELPLAQQRCAMAKSRAAAYPGGLGAAAEVLGTPGKDAIGDRLIKKLTVPCNPTKKNPARRWTPETAPGDFEIFYQYNEQDVRAEMAASARLPDMSAYEFSVWQFDQTCNRRGMCIDTRAVDDCIAIVEQATLRANAELVTITNGAVESYTEPAAMLRWLAWRGLHLHELDEESVYETLKRSDLAPDMKRVLQIRAALSFGSVKKLYAMRARVGSDGRLREQYIYHGAHTSLWNGQGVQPANLFKPSDPRFEKPEGVEAALRVIACRAIELLEYVYPDLDPLEVVANCLRSMIVAAPGHRLISADYNAIQAVVTSAIAGEEWRLEVFRTHGKIYEAMAGRLTGRSLEEYAAYKANNNGAHHPDRQLGKLAVLSADFGAWINGWKRFGADKLLGSDENIKHAILRTRNAIPAIVELWGGQTRDKFRPDERPELYGLEGCIVAAVKEPGRAFAYRGIVYQMHGPTLYCRTTDGGLMRYHNAKLHPSQRPYARQWEYEVTYEGWNSNATKGAKGWQTMNLYGGVATQNVVSRVSRQVQALALLRLEAHGYPIVMHTHDENVSEVPIGSHHTAAEHNRLTAELPAWAHTPDGQPWPIKVPPSWEHPRYGKWP